MIGAWIDNFQRATGTVAGALHRVPRAMACAILLASVSIAGPAKAQSGLVVDVDPNVTLTCLAGINFTASSTLMTQIFAGTAGGDVAITTPTATSVVGGSGANINAALSGLNTTPTADPANIVGTVVGCRVDGTPSFGNYQVNVALTGNTILDGPGGSNVSVISVTSRRNGSGSGFATSYTFPGTIFFSTGSVFLDFRIGFDLSNASTSGNHSSTNSGTFTVTVTAP